MLSAYLGFYSPVERPGRRRDVDVPAESPEPSFEVCSILAPVPRMRSACWACPAAGPGRWPRAAGCAELTGAAGAGGCARRASVLRALWPVGMYPPALIGRGAVAL